MEKVVVVGAGVAGLTAAYRLQQHGFEVTVLEAESRVGGRMSSIEKNGYQMDLAALALSNKYTAMHRMVNDLGINDQIIPVPDIIGIPKGDKVYRMHSARLGKTATTGLLTWRSIPGAIRIGVDAYRLGRTIDWNDLGAAKGFDTETVRQWALRRGSREIDYMTDAVLRGGLMTSSDRMSAIDLQFLAVSFFGTGLFTFRDGVGALPAALASRVNVRLNTRVTQVEEHRDGVRVSSVADGRSETTEDAAACVIALSAHDMAAVHPGLSPSHRAIVDDLEYVRLITINLALNYRPRDPAMFLALSERVDPDLCAVFMDHNRHPDHFAADKGMVTVFWHHDWNTAEWATPDDEVVGRTVRAANKYVPGLDDGVEMSNVTRWSNAFLYSRPGTYQALHNIAMSRAAANRIHLAGDYFGGPSTNSALCSGERAAEHVIASLGASSNLVTGSARRSEITG